MGQNSSISHTDDTEQPKKAFVRQRLIPEHLQAAHFTPSSFPLIPLVNSSATKKVRKSWESIMRMKFQNSNGIDTSPITVFYNEFYRRLYMFDSDGVFDTVLAQNAKGSGIAAKGAIIIRIIKFAVKIEDTPACKESLVALGRAHCKMKIRPWQYSIFVEMLISTISHMLGQAATYDVMNAWVNVFAFMLQHMLPPAIRGLTQGDEFNITLTPSDNKEGTTPSRRPRMDTMTDENKVTCLTNSYHSGMDTLKQLESLESFDATAK